MRYPSWHQLKFPLAFVCASAIHGGLLWLPMPPVARESEPIPPMSADSSQEAIATIPLADLVPSTPNLPPETIPEPKPTPKVTPAPPAPRAVAPPQPTPKPKPQDINEAKTVEPKPTPEPSPELEAKTVEPKPAPEPTPEPTPELESKTVEPEPTPEPTAELMAGIPHLEGAKAGCHGSEDCHFLEGATVRNVTQDLQASLEAQGFRLSESYRDTGLRVYEVSRNDKPPQFLHIASDNAGRDTFYVLSPQLQTLEELRSPSP